MSINYPGLYDLADKRSAKAQQKHFLWLRIEYSLLIFSSVNAFVTYEYKYYVAFVLFVFLMMLMVFKVKSKFEQEWYKYRAISESIKTTTWNFIMKSEPFDDDDELKNIKEFSSYLTEIIDGSEYISKTIDHDVINKGALTGDMKNVRGMDYLSRRDFYVVNRIEDQRSWYVSKSADNKRKGKAWGYAIFSLYFFAFACSIYNAFFASTSEGIIPISIVTTIAASLVGWSQVKRYGELSASYILTAHEIGLIKEQASYVSSEADFADFVRESEMAFSREHTQWIARRVANKKMR
ncbi:DUF4231 domain-containing protein [Serratia sarumanii]|uniref:DUF4231 domain-containing protein n=1 Tax=Serratia sarumanii TaxID=3020826 RepID=UPI00249E74C6|nr:MULTISPECIES: DUF4231 domain-containing protein [unclassified Serratia (in: enterobacteria)]WGZ65499.1 DUF4231 domain-containing protein [Serratia sp. K-M0706]WRV63664.1 DUF4231 domain-containing protein [Serratia sp. K-M0228]